VNFGTINRHKQSRAASINLYNYVLRVEGGIYVLLDLEFDVRRPNDVDKGNIIMALTNNRYIL